VLLKKVSAFEHFKGTLLIKVDIDRFHENKKVVLTTVRLIKDYR